MKRTLFAAILMVVMCACNSQDVIELGLLKQKTLSETQNELAIGCETLDRDFADYHAYKEYLEPLGMRYLRLQAGWAKTEVVKGVYDWAWLDSIIDDAVSRGLEPWVEFSYGNPIYEGGGTVFLVKKWPVSEEGVTAWCNWVGAMVTRYKGKVHQWEFWNEPDDKEGDDSLIDLAIKTARIVKEVDPESKIAAFGLRGFGEQAQDKVRLLSNALKDNEKNLFDWISYHGYYFRPEDSYLKCGAAYIKFLRELGWDIPIWQGEMGAPSTGFKGGGLSTYPWSEVSQAKFGIRKMLFDHSYGVRTSLFGIADMNYKGDAINIKNCKGLLETNDKNDVVRPKLSYGTVRNMVSVWDNLDEICDSTAISMESGDKVIAKFLYKDTETGLSSAVIWDYTKAPVDDCTCEYKTVEISGFAGRSPVCIDLLTGRVTQIPFKRKNGKTVFERFPLYDSPVVLCDRSLIELQ